MKEYIEELDSTWSHIFLLIELNFSIISEYNITKASYQEKGVHFYLVLI